MPDGEVYRAGRRALELVHEPKLAIRGAASQTPAMEGRLATAR